MFFAYVHTSDDTIPVPVTEFDKKGIINGNTFLLGNIVKKEGIEWSDVVKVDVETGADHDEHGYPADSDNPETVTCYVRGV
jgi:hypothetical protein